MKLIIIMFSMAFLMLIVALFSDEDQRHLFIGLALCLSVPGLIGFGVMGNARG